MTEKKIFTKRRSDILQHYPCSTLAEKWGKYCFIPFDVPKFEDKNLIDWFFEVSKPSVRNDLPTIKNYYDSISDPKVFENYVKANKDNLDNANYSIYDAVDVILDDGWAPKSEMWSYNIRNDFLKIHKNFYNQLLDTLPFKKIKSFRMWSSTGNFALHRDMHENFVDYPNLFRIMLFDNNPNSTLYISQMLPDTKQANNEFFIPRINETNTFAINNLRTKHGSFYQSPYKKILILLDNYELDNTKMDMLMEKSIEKYLNYCLVDQYNLEDYVEY